MVAKELAKAAGLENIFKTINKANNTQIAIVTVFAEGFNAGIKAAQTSAELDAVTTLRRTVSDYDQSLYQVPRELEMVGK